MIDFNSPWIAGSFPFRVSNLGRLEILCAGCLCLLVLVGAGSVSALSIRFVGDENGLVGPQALAIAASGDVIAGSDLFLTGWRSTPNGGIEILPSLPGSSNGGVLVEDASADGAVLIGQASGNSGFEAFRWSETTGIVSIDPGSNTTVVPRAVSGDGSIIVGVRDSSAFRWTVAGGFESLDPGSTSFSSASDISADGKVIVGTRSTAFRWTASTGIVELGALAGTDGSGDAVVSENGLVIAGAARETGSQSSVLFRWTAQTGMVGLGRPAGTDAITAVDIPSDGSTIIGRADLILPGGGIFDVPFVWSQAHDMQTLAEYLDIRGGIPIGLAADRATLTGISEDGLVLVGYEVDTQGLIRSFILDLRTPVSTHRVWPYLAIALGMVALDAIRRMGNRSARILPSWSR